MKTLEVSQSTIDWTQNEILNLARNRVREHVEVNGQHRFWFEGNEFVVMADVLGVSLTKTTRAQLKDTRLNGVVGFDEKAAPTLTKDLSGLRRGIAHIADLMNGTA